MTQVVRIPPEPAPSSPSWSPEATRPPTRAPGPLPICLVARGSEQQGSLAPHEDMTGHGEPHWGRTPRHPAPLSPQQSRTLALTACQPPGPVCLSSPPPHPKAAPPGLSAWGQLDGWHRLPRPPCPSLGLSSPPLLPLLPVTPTDPSALPAPGPLHRARCHQRLPLARQFPRTRRPPSAPSPAGQRQERLNPPRIKPKARSLLAH